MRDLKGKVIATNAAGSAVDVAMRAMLRKAAWRTSVTTPCWRRRSRPCRRRQKDGYPGAAGLNKMKV